MDRSDLPKDHPCFAAVTRAAARLQEAFGDAPPWAVILGSGLGALDARLDAPTRRAFADVGLPAPGIAGHAGEVVCGGLGGARVALLRGRVHGYEGRPNEDLTQSVRALHAWGVRALVVTASVGTLRREMPVGGLARVLDHINLTGRAAIAGPAWGTRFPDMTHAWRGPVSDALADAARALGIDLPDVVYAAMPGPTYETPAEIRMLGRLGGDVVGMSLVHEGAAAAEVGLQAAGLVCITNPGAGLRDDAANHQEVLDAALAASDRLADLLTFAAPAIVRAAG